jgi:hypothetical protein
MNHVRAGLAILAVLLVFLPLLALGQQAVLINGYDVDTTDAGTTRRVRVDSTGRLLTVSGSVLADGGSSTAVQAIFNCNARAQTVTSVGTSAVTISTTLASRWFTRVCNSVENTGVPVVKCRDDGVNPVLGVANAGEALNTGDCATYYTTVPIRCIADTAATAVSQSECQ